MKRFIAGLSFLHLAGLCFSQSSIHIFSGNFSFNSHQSKVQVYNNPQFTTPPEGADQFWDYSLASPVFIHDTVHFVAANFPGFPATALKQLNKTEELYSFSYSYDEVLEKSADSYTRSGRIIPAQDYCIQGITGNVTDSMLIPAQSFYYQEPYDEIAFPCTYGSAWNSNYTYKVQMLSRVPSIGSYNAAVEHRAYVNRSSQVVGWGKILPPSGGSFVPLARAVLLLKISEVQLDSIYVNGTPSNMASLLLFGVNQGNSVMRNFYFFVDTADMQPVAVFEYGASDFQLCSKAIFRMNEMNYLGTSDGFIEPFVQLFPNPASNLLTFDSNVEIKKVKIISVEGKTVFDLSNDIRNTIHLDFLQNGIYYIEFITNSGEIALRKFIVSK
jgi:hypothetical protein